MGKCYLNRFFRNWAESVIILTKIRQIMVNKFNRKKTLYNDDSNWIKCIHIITIFCKVRK